MELKPALSFLSRDKVRIGNLPSVMKKINALIRDGPDKIHLIADFDQTISRSHLDGEKKSSSYGAVESDPGFPEECRTMAQAMMEKYSKIEHDPSLTESQKRPFMEEWYVKSFENILSSIKTSEQLKKIAVESDIHLRCSTLSLLTKLQENGVPTLIFSAGLGDIIRFKLQSLGIEESDKLSIVSNFVDIDESTGRILSFREPWIFSFDKDANHPSARGYFAREDIVQRKNAVLIGDTIADEIMANNAPGIRLSPHGDSVLLKVGFLNNDFESKMQKYLDTFDIVLVDDQTVDVVCDIFDRVIGGE